MRKQMTLNIELSKDEVLDILAPIFLRHIKQRIDLPNLTEQDIRKQLVVKHDGDYDYAEFSGVKFEMKLGE